MSVKTSEAMRSAAGNIHEALRALEEAQDDADADAPHAEAATAFAGALAEVLGDRSFAPSASSCCWTTPPTDVIPRGSSPTAGDRPNAGDSVLHAGARRRAFAMDRCFVAGAPAPELRNRSPRDWALLGDSPQRLAVVASRYAARAAQ